MTKPTICIVATVPFALRVFMRVHIRKLAGHYNVVLITGGTPDELGDLLDEHVSAIRVTFSRRVALWSDLTALLQLCRILRAGRYDVVHSLMPKTGLLAMVAGRLCGVPHRIHTFTGQVWATRTGLARYALKRLDRLIAWCATGLLTDSLSQRQFLIDQQVVPASRVQVLGQGSVCGVDLARFRPDPEARQRIRAALGISGQAPLILFLGRVNREKGVLDLANAMRDVIRQRPDAHLLVVGPDECGLDVELATLMADMPRNFHRVGYTDHPEHYMASADLLCLPSYREGFGSVIVEAAAVGIPAVASRIYGLTDAVCDLDTGLLHEPGNREQIRAAIDALISDDDRRITMGRRARHRAMACFDQNVVSEAMRQYYQELLR